MCFLLWFWVRSPTHDDIIKWKHLWGKPLVTGGFPTHKPVMGTFDVFFDLCMNKWLSKQLRYRWFEIPSHSSWCHCNLCNNHLGLKHNIWHCEKWVVTGWIKCCEHILKTYLKWTILSTTFEQYIIHTILHYQRYLMLKIVVPKGVHLGTPFRLQSIICQHGLKQ